MALRTDNDAIVVVGREVHWLRCEPTASKLANGHLERALGMPATFRNITTVRKLAEQY